MVFLAVSYTGLNIALSSRAHLSRRKFLTRACRGLLPRPYLYFKSQLDWYVKTNIYNIKLATFVSMQEECYTCLCYREYNVLGCVEPEEAFWYLFGFIPLTDISVLLH